MRELENVVRKLLILRDPELIARDLYAKVGRKPRRRRSPPRRLPMADLCPRPPPRGAAPILEQVTKAKHQAETEAIMAALNSTRWNRKQAAALLKIDYKALLYKMKKLGSRRQALASLPGVAGAESDDRRRRS